MKIRLIIFLSALCIGNVFAQTEDAKTLKQKAFYPDTIKACNPQRIYAIVEKMPEYNGGLKQLELALSEKSTIDKKVSGRIYLTAFINCESFAYAFQILRGINEQTDNQILNEIKQLQNWTSGIQSNNPVDCQLTIGLEIKKGIITITNK